MQLRTFLILAPDEGERSAAHSILIASARIYMRPDGVHKLTGRFAGKKNPSPVGKLPNLFVC